MKPTLLYLCGLPGTGKATIGRLLEKELGWSFLWHHDLNSVFRVVKSSHVPNLVNQIVESILDHLIHEKKNIIYARGSRHPQTMDLLELVTECTGYRLVVVRLAAAYETLVKRVTERERLEFRVNSREELDEYLDYLDSYKQVEVPEEYVVHTDGYVDEAGQPAIPSPEWIAFVIKNHLLGTVHEFANA